MTVALDATDDSPTHEAPRPALRDTWVLDSHDDPKAVNIYRAACVGLFEITLHEEDGRFHNRLDGYNLGDILVGRCRGVAQTFDRTPTHIRRDGQDQVQIVIQLEGVWSGDYDGRFADRSMGSVRLIDQGRPYHVETSAFETFNIMIPSPLPDAVGQGDLHGFVLSEQRPAVSLLIRHVAALWEALPNLSVAEANAAARAIPTLLACAVSADASPRPTESRGLGATALAIARHEVDRRLDDEDLTPNILSGRMGLGRSAMYRLFEKHGGVAAFIQARRLDKAFDVLLHSAGRINLATVSQDHGFKSASHFSRAFRSRFGLPPGEMRERMRSGNPPLAGDDPSAVFAWLKRL